MVGMFFQAWYINPMLMLGQGHEGLYSIYVHASRRAELKSVWNSSIFVDREIRSQEVLFSRHRPTPHFCIQQL
jgi:hypothetical protein